MADFPYIPPIASPPGQSFLDALQAISRGINAQTQVVQANPVKSYAFAGLPSPASIGQLAIITNSTTAAWGTIIAGGGANRVLAWFNGSNWTVVGA